MTMGHPTTGGSPSLEMLPPAFQEASRAIAALRPAVDTHVTPERVRRYLTALADVPAPSTAASALRAPVLRSLLDADGVLDPAVLTLDANFLGTGSAVLLTGSREARKPLWYFAHLDTISYLIQPRTGDAYPLVPFCYHLIGQGRRDARAYRFDLSSGRYHVCAAGHLVTRDGAPFFLPATEDPALIPGDRIVPVATSRLATDGTFTGQLDNAGAVAALAVAAPLLARSGVEALLAFPDEEEGPEGSGNQVMGRGAARIVSQLPPPDLAVVADMQQARSEGSEGDGAPTATLLGGGAVLAEFSSLARGAVTPPHLFALAKWWSGLLAMAGVTIQHSNNSYTSRSDDVSVFLKTPNILLLGFPGLNRHFDHAEPSARLSDIVDLAKALVYVAVLRPILGDLRQSWGSGPWTS